ncbi:SDR family NAD(P)-dependent oxidoreductase [Pseudonocardia sp. CA-107938]|uniref:SDR family NAD(P)-dependent oxidoreductase n=1 Tax=Pseudonocardia sp. CA-107938 TaxID=3240021 RepID=UPI003D8F2024
MPAIALVAAGNRLGLALGTLFGRHGFDVAFVARSEERLGELTGKVAADGIRAAGFAADVTDRPALAGALERAADRFDGIEVLHYAAPVAGSSADVRRTGAVDVTASGVAAQIDSICLGAVAATRAVLPAMLAAGRGTLLYTTGASSVVPTPMFVGAGMAGAALRRWVLGLESELADKGIFAGHVAIGAWLAGTPGAPEGAVLTEPEQVARRYWDLHVRREPVDQLVTG